MSTRSIERPSTRKCHGWSRLMLASAMPPTTATRSRTQSKKTSGRLLGRERTNLEYRALGELLEDPAAEMDRLQRAVSAASEAVSRRYFPRGPATSWVREIS